MSMGDEEKRFGNRIGPSRYSQHFAEGGAVERKHALERNVLALEMEDRRVCAKQEWRSRYRNKREKKED